MDTILLKTIDFQPDLPRLLQYLRLEEGSRAAARLEELATEAQAVARPKALYGIAFIEEKGDDYVLIDGQRFTSRVLRVNLESSHRVFPYVATCGQELEAWSHSIDDLLERFWVDTIKEQVLGAAMAALDADLVARFAPGPTSDMNPGSLPDWPLDEQRPLFRLLGDPRAAIGVDLSASCLMTPIKSVSGLRFPTDSSFVSCQLCPRERCPSRRARYDPELYKKRFARG